MSKAYELSLKHSMRCFFNSYIRDLNPEYKSDESVFLIPLSHGMLQIKVDFFSLVGMHEYSGEIIHHIGTQSKVISFLESAELIYAGNSSLQLRLINSIDNMSKMIDFNHLTLEYDFLHSEQSLLVGHNMHPHPKSRLGFLAADLELYGPEFRASFELNWLLVKSELIWQERSNSFGDQEWQIEFYPGQVPKGFVALPVHPWQKNILFSHPDIAKYLDQQLVFEGIKVHTKWFATSSMRSLFAFEKNYMLKFSMSVQMTNSIRHLQEKEVVRGMLIHDAFLTRTGRSFSEKYPRFKVMHEPLCLGIKDLQGHIIPETIVLLRENPFIGSTKNAVMLSTLNQDHPVHGFALLKECLKKCSPTLWFEHFIDEAIIPLIIAQADFGVMLGAHQQNLVIALTDGLPSGAWFRDCQGTGFSDLAIGGLFKDLVSSEKFLGHVIPTDAAKILFSYYLVINSVMSTIYSLARASEIKEEDLIKIFRYKIIQLRSKVQDTSVLDYLLDSPELHQKGNFRCSLLGINENTTQSPLSIYNTFKNPFYLELV